MDKEEKKQCQNCKSEFIIDASDFDFYEKMQVPAPTFCPECRFQRRSMFRNERVLYKRECDLCRKKMVTVFHPERKMTVYCQPCYWGDGWDQTQFGIEYDPSRNIFDQMKDLQKNTPHMSLLTDYWSLTNSEYINHAGQSKNCYLIFNADFCENVYYSNISVSVKDSADCYMIGESELCYEAIDTGSSYKIFFSENIANCTNIYFSKSLEV